MVHISTDLNNTVVFMAAYAAVMEAAAALVLRLVKSFSSEYDAGRSGVVNQSRNAVQ